MQPEVTVVSMCHDSRSFDSTRRHSPSFDVTRRQFLDVVVDNMKGCFPDQQLLAVLSPSTWPTDEDELAVYGDSDVIKLARLLQVDTVQLHLISFAYSKTIDARWDVYCKF